MLRSWPTDISGWAPRWAPARDQLNLQRTNLLGLRDHQIVDSQVVWDVEHDKWFADLPVILMLDDGRQLEVSWQKFDDLSITWSTIDVSTTPTALVTWPLTWRSQGHESLRAINGGTITAVAATEHRFTTQQVSPPTQVNTTWLVGGLWHSGSKQITLACTSSMPLTRTDSPTNPSKSAKTTACYPSDRARSNRPAGAKSS